MTDGGDAPERGALAGRRIGLIGLGLMGQPMARRLAGAGAELALWTRSIEKAEELAAALPGASALPSPKHVAEAVDTVVVMVTDADAVEAVVFDPFEDQWGLAHGLTEDALVIDMGTTAVDRTRDFAGRIRMIGGSWVDAPVSGGTVAAEAVDMFLSIIGAEAGAMALRSLATGGVFLCGGITAKLGRATRSGGGNGSGAGRTVRSCGGSRRSPSTGCDQRPSFCGTPRCSAAHQSDVGRLGGELWWREATAKQAVCCHCRRACRRALCRAPPRGPTWSGG